MQDWYDRYINVEQEIYKPKKQISVGRLENSIKIKNSADKIDTENVMAKEHKSTSGIKGEKIKKIMPEIPKTKETISQKVNRTSTYADVVKN